MRSGSAPAEPFHKQNIRGMQLGQNLWHKPGQWHLSFTGEELKIGYRRGKLNTQK
jgi:hypothetical protein